MNFKLLYLSIILGVLISAPNYLHAQVKSLSEYKIIKKDLSALESASLNTVSSPSNAYRIERENYRFSIIDNNTGFKHSPEVTGRMRVSGWSKNEDRVVFDITHIPVGNNNFTGAVGVYSFSDKSTKIFRPEKYFLMNSRLSADGKMIVATGSTREKGYVIVIDIESGELKVVNDKVSSQPIWVPNSDKIAYVEFVRRGQDRIVVADIKTGEKSDLVNSAYMTRHEISPDGSKIAFTSPDSETRGLRALYIIDIDGTNQIKIATIDIAGHFHPRWSPEGRFISYTNPIIEIVRGHHERTVASEIYVYDVNSGKAIKVADRSGALHHIVSWENDFDFIISAEVDEKRTYSSYKLEQ